MKRRIVTEQDVFDIRVAHAFMSHARDLLRKARAGKSADYVARAMKSVEGADRHVSRLLGAQLRKQERAR